MSDNHSLLTPLYRRRLWDPLARRLPPELHPDGVTWLGTACCAGSFLAAVSHHFAAAAVLLFAYLTADNVDGAHARRTGQASPRGEFLDHWLDTLNFGFLTLGYYVGFGIEPGLGLLCAGVALLAVALHFGEQRATGRLVFPAVSDVEMNTLIVIYYVLAARFGTEFPGSRLPVFFTLAGAPIAAALCMSRARLGRMALLLAAPIAAVVGWHLAGGLPARPAYVLMALLSPCLSGRLILSIVRQDPGIGPSARLAAAIGTAALLAAPAGVGWLLAAVAAILAAGDFVRGMAGA